MSLRPKLGLVAAGLCVGLLASGRANASVVSYSGTLVSDDQVQLYTYILAQASDVVFSTASYGGGVSNGVTTPAGGFVPVLSLFDTSGTVIGSDGGDATCSAGMGVDPTTNMCDDAYLKESLTAGSYILAVTEFFNVPVGPNLSDGFLMQGQGDYTGPTCGTTGAFYETDIAPCVQRTGNFDVTAATTPEPSTLWLGAIPMILLGVVRRRKAGLQN
jgi:hypothetical protein